MTPWLSGISAVIVALLSFVIKLAYDMGQMRSVLKSAECVPDMKVRLEHLATSMELYQKMLDPHLALVLRDWPTHKERDILMQKLAQESLTLPEIDRLDELLRVAMREYSAADKQLAIGLARARLTWLRGKIQSENM